MRNPGGGGVGWDGPVGAVGVPPEGPVEKLGTVGEGIRITGEELVEELDEGLEIGLGEASEGDVEARGEMGVASFVFACDAAWFWVSKGGALGWRFTTILSGTGKVGPIKPVLSERVALQPLKNSTKIHPQSPILLEKVKYSDSVVLIQNSLKSKNNPQTFFSVDKTNIFHDNQAAKKWQLSLKITRL